VTVNELITELQELDGDLLVVVSQDEEGNGFNELVDIGVNNRYKDRQVGLDHLTPELEKQRFCEEDVMEDGVPCIVLWP